MSVVLLVFYILFVTFIVIPVLSVLLLACMFSYDICTEQIRDLVLWLFAGFPVCVHYRDFLDYFDENYGEHAYTIRRIYSLVTVTVFIAAFYFCYSLFATLTT